MRKLANTVLVGGLFLVSACGGGDSDATAEQRGDRAFERSIRAAQRVSEADFPPAGGRTLQDLADGVLAVQTGLATQEFTPGRNRLAFGVIGRDNKLVYGPSAVYIARTPNDRAEGPFPAPADPLVVDPPFRSKQAALESDAVAAIYETEVTLPRPGRYAVLVLTKRPDGSFVGGGTEIRVKRDSVIPAVGERLPRVDTETVTSSGGDSSRSTHATRPTTCTTRTSPSSWAKSPSCS